MALVGLHTGSVLAAFWNGCASADARGALARTSFFWRSRSSYRGRTRYVKGRKIVECLSLPSIRKADSMLASEACMFVKYSIDTSALKRIERLPTAR
jgi:hypothetical protein